jgi:hypothetical protein
MEYSATTRLPLQTLMVSFTLVVTPKNLNGMTLRSYLFHHLGESIKPQRGRKCKRALKFFVFDDSCQRRENIKPKAKRPHHHFKKF